MKVAVLGCGPAGLLAAHAVELNGHRPTIFSRKVKGIMPGAMYIHEAIPEICSAEPDALITYAKLGDAEGYAKKVYGDYSHPTSWNKFSEGKLPAWSMSAVYDTLWEHFEKDIVNWDIDSPFLDRLYDGPFDWVVSTIPATALCYGDCWFTSQRIFVYRDHRDSCEQLGDPCVIYNGQPEQAWYRSSLIFGEGSTEYSEHCLGNLGSVGYRGTKPIDTNCRCRPYITRAGRFGKWHKGILVHDVFKEVLSAVQ